MDESVKKEELRELIARALEEGQPVTDDGTPLTRFEDLFAVGERAPVLGLRYEEATGELRAERFESAYGGALWIPFNFELKWEEHRSGTAEGCASQNMLLMAAMTRGASLFSVEKGLSARFGA